MMNVVVVIPDGEKEREAILVRALPLMQRDRLSPELVSHCFRYPDGLPLTGGFRGLTAYVIGDETQPHAPLPANQWDSVLASLIALSSECDAEEIASPEELERDAPGCDDRLRAHHFGLEELSLLPPAVFVWKDEFEASYWPLFPDDDSLCFTPLADRDTAALVMEGFGQYAPEQDIQSLPTGHQPVATSPAVPPDPTLLDTTGMVAWHAVILEAWPDITKAHGHRPEARKVLSWIKKNGPRDTIPSNQPDRDALH